MKSLALILATTIALMWAALLMATMPENNCMFEYGMGTSCR